MARALAAPAPEAVDPPPRPRWVRPAVIGAGVLAAGLAGVAVHQGVAARRAYGDADAMLLPGGALIAPYTRADHDGALSRGDAANRNAWLAGAGAAATAATGALLHWRFGD